MKHKFFNTAGPCNPDHHYMLAATTRLREENVMQLVEMQGYFVVHAPRQTGKTTAIMALAQELTESEAYTAVVLSLEVGAGFPGDVGTTELAILGEWRWAIAAQLPETLHPSDWAVQAPVGQRINAFFSQWAFGSSRPLVILLDEVDALQNHVLVSILRQLRVGFSRRPRYFPSSVALIGLRDVRDYKVKSGGKPQLGTSSPFNVAVRSIMLRNFEAAEVKALLKQHSQATGQPFTEAALERVWQLTQGQPWLVNALAKVTVEELVVEVTQPITVEVIETAKELLILRRQTHLDQLVDKLREPRVQQVIEPLLAGETLSDVSLDDLDYVADLGLVAREQDNGVQIANPIYREIIPRTLTLVTQASLPTIQPSWLTAAGELDPDKLLTAFLDFWQQHGQPLLKSAPYHEIAPHLVMMAFLHRVVNGQGTIEREYAIGSRRMDLLVRYGSLQLAFELKVWRERGKDPLAEGLKQLDHYLTGLGLNTGWLVIFDQRHGLPDIGERLSAKVVEVRDGRFITVIRA